MTLKPLREPDRIAVAGDWHGNLQWALWAVDYITKNKADVILHVGDFGYKFAKGYLNALNAALVTSKVPLLFVDGNHDHQRTIARYPMHDSGVRQLRSNIFHLPRGFRWEWYGKTHLALGGAYSVDRAFRDQIGPQQHWWPEEEITKSQALGAMRGGPADIMVTHDCPSGVPIPGIEDSRGIAQFGHKAIVGANLHRTRLRGVVEVVQPKLLIHGHYHKFHVTTVQMDYGQLKVLGLDCDGGALESNVRFLDPLLS